MEDTYRVSKIRKPNPNANEPRRYDVDGRQFCYDSNKALLCWVDSEGEVLDAMGLSLSNWEENPQYWCEVYAARIDEELSYLW